jgi:hypothetical protein
MLLLLLLLLLRLPVLVLLAAQRLLCVRHGRKRCGSSSAGVVWRRNSWPRWTSTCWYASIGIIRRLPAALD